MDSKNIIQARSKATKAARRTSGSRGSRTPKIIVSHVEVCKAVDLSYEGHVSVSVGGREVLSRIPVIFRDETFVVDVVSVWARGLFEITRAPGLLKRINESVGREFLLVRKLFAAAVEA